MTLQLRPTTALPAIPPPPDGSGIVPVAAQNDNIPPPPDGSGIAPEAHSDLINADDAPPQAASHMTPEQEAQYNTLIRTGSADDVRAFLHGIGASSGGDLDAFIAKRDAAKAANQPVNYDVTYALPQDQGGDAVRAFGNGVAHGASLGTADEIHGFLNGVHALVQGGSYSDAYDRTVDTDRAQLGADERDHGIASVSGNLVGGLALPAGLEKWGITASLDAVGLAAGKAALREGASMAEARTIAARAVTRRIAAEGGAYGAAFGAGSADGGPGQRLLGAAEGGAEGLAGGAALGAAGARLARPVVRATPTLGQDVLAAGDRLGITPFAPDVAGPTTRRLTAGIAQTPGGAKQIVDAASRVTGDARTARDTIAASVGNALNPSEAGETALAGAKQYIARTSAQGNAMYRAAETAAAGSRIKPTEALNVLNQHIQELSETPGGAEGLLRLEGLRDALQQGNFSVQGIRNMRTALRDDFANNGLRGSDIERRVNQVVDAAGQDVVDDLRGQGNGHAADLYANADKFWRERLDTIDNTLAPIIGKKGDRSGEQVMASLQSNLRGNGVRLDKFVQSLPTQEQADVRASLIGRLGVATKGTQNAEGDAFSLPTFLTHWNDISESSKARLFGTETRAALNDLAKVAQGAKEAQRYANHSNTGGVVGMLATGASGALGLKTLGLSIALPYAGGKLLANPSVARWLARAPRTSLGAGAYIERLGRIAKAEPAIASEVLGLQQRLTQAIGGSGVRAAAEPDNGANIVDGQGGQQQSQQQQVAP